MTTDVDATFDAYVATFFEAVAGEITDELVAYFNIPMMLVNPTWGVVAVTDEATLRNVLAMAIAGHAANGNVRSEFLGRETRLLAEALATISYTEVAYNAPGVETLRIGGTYTFIKSNDAWRIAAITHYDPQI